MDRCCCSFQGAKCRGEFGESPAGASLSRQTPCLLDSSCKRMWKIGIMFSRHQLKYFSDKNNNNKLSSTQKINCVQQGDRRVHSPHCTTGLHRRGQAGRTPEGHRAQGLPEVKEREPLSQAGGSPACAICRGQAFLPYVRLVFCFLVCLFMSSGPLLSEATWPRALTPWRRLVSCSSKGMSLS